MRWAGVAPTIANTMLAAANNELKKYFFEKVLQYQNFGYICITKSKIMIHNQNITVLADNGIQIFLASDIERILNMAYDYDYSSGSRVNRYTDQEVCEHWDISINELNRMKHTLSYDFCHDSNGDYKY